MGHSQIIPYIVISSKFFEQIIIYSQEKNHHSQIKINKLKKYLNSKNILWYYSFFSNKFKILSKFYNLINLNLVVLKILFKNNITHYHGRSHVPAECGLFFKFLFKYKLLFDCRGFWAEERIDNGNWSMNSILGRFLYNRYSRIEKKLFYSSDNIILLTKKAFKLRQHHQINTKNIQIIPCVTNFSKFKILSSYERKFLRKKYSIDDNAILLTYFGSLDKIYNLKYMLKFFAFCSKRNAKIKLLIISKDYINYLDYVKSNISLNLKNKIIFKSSSSSELYKFIGIADYSLCFISPSKARNASSPTKIGESLSCGVPIIYKSGVGDLDDHLSKIHYNIKLDKFDNSNFKQAFEKILKYSINKKIVRMQSIKTYGLENAYFKYKNIYDI